MYIYKYIYFYRNKYEWKGSQVNVKGKKRQEHICIVQGGKYFILDQDVTIKMEKTEYN